jgi:hypothetical protein
MRSRINGRDGLVTIESQNGAVVLRVEDTYRSETTITLDSGIAAMLAGEIERAVWAAQRDRIERRDVAPTPLERQA